MIDTKKEQVLRNGIAEIIAEIEVGEKKKKNRRSVLFDPRQRNT